MGLSVRTKTALMYAVQQQLKVMQLKTDDPERAKEARQLTFHVAAVERELPEAERENATKLIEGVAKGVATRVRNIEEAAVRDDATLRGAIQDYASYLGESYNYTVTELTMQARKIAEQAVARA
ncbi:MAG TPA: hypothetical protein VFZ48_01620 [Candidatus Saccharimonadales bacterium]